MDNETHQHLLREFRKIIDDPNETPDRKATAKRGLASLTRGSHSSPSLGDVEARVDSGALGSRRGREFIAQDSDYDGYGPGRV